MQSARTVRPVSRRLCSLSFSPATSSAGVLDSLDCILPSLRARAFCCLEGVAFVVEQLVKAFAVRPVSRRLCPLYSRLLRPLQVS